MADEVFEVRANGKQLTLLRKPRDYDPSDHDAIVTVLQAPAECNAFQRCAGAQAPQAQARRSAAVLRRVA